MKIEEIRNEEKYKIPENIIEQKDMRLSEYGTVLEAVKDENLDFNFKNTVLVLGKNGKMFEINLTGALIWEGLKKRERFEEIVKTIEEIFEADSEMIKKDIKDFFKELLNKQFVVRI